MEFEGFGYLITDFEEALGKVVESIKTIPHDDLNKEYAERLPVDEAPLDMLRIESRLNELLVLLRENDMGSEDYFESLKSDLIRTPFREDLEKIETCIRDLDFKNALSRLEEILKNSVDTD